MLRLVNADLPSPAAIARFPSRAPLLRARSITVPSQRPPLFLAESFASFGSRPGFEPDILPMPAPQYVGRLYQFEYSAAGAADADIEGDEVISLQQISINGVPFTPLSLEDTDTLTPGLVWGDAYRLNLYSSAEFPAVPANPGDTLLAQILLQRSLPIPDSSFNVTLDLSQFIGDRAFTISRAASEGLVWSAAANPSAPLTGEFVQAGATLTLYGSPTYAPRALRPVILDGLWQATVPAAAAALVTFDLASTDLEYLDEAQYLGLRFSPIRDRAQPQIGEFYASRQSATLIAPLNRAGWLRPSPPPSVTALSGLGTVTYSPGDA